MSFIPKTTKCRKPGTSSSILKRPGSSSTSSLLKHKSNPSTKSLSLSTTASSPILSSPEVVYVKKSEEEHSATPSKISLQFTTKIHPSPVSHTDSDDEDMDSLVLKIRAKQQAAVSKISWAMDSPASSRAATARSSVDENEDSHHGTPSTQGLTQVLRKKQIKPTNPEPVEESRPTIEGSVHLKGRKMLRMNRHQLETLTILRNRVQDLQHQCREELYAFRRQMLELASQISHRNEARRQQAYRYTE